MPVSSDNKYRHIEASIDKILSDGRLHVFPPGSFVFIAVNLLMLAGTLALVITAQGILFRHTESAALFMVSAEFVMVLLIITPPFLIARGFFKALGYFKTLTISLFVLMSVFFIFELLVNGTRMPVAITGFICFALAYLIIQTPAYLLFSLFTARRRELALQKLQRNREHGDNK